MIRKKIAVLTTSRADYGLFYWTLREIRSDSLLKLQLVACGSHLDRARGFTVGEIEKDGFQTAARVETLPEGDAAGAVARAVGKAAAGFASAWERLKPDLLMVLGDRWVLLPSGSSAVALGIPIAHVHGGESSEGVIDEQVRHAVTKLSHLHFPAAEAYRRRILQMGEDPRRVTLAGAPGLENLARLRPLPLGDLERIIGMRLDRPFAVVTCQPETTGGAGLISVAEAATQALEKTRLPAVITSAGIDAGGAAINRHMRAWAGKHPVNAAVVESLGREKYLSLLLQASAVLGNSSSGLIEAPSARVPTVNIGDRQKGRLRAPSVIDCRASGPAVIAALKKALSPEFQKRCDGSNPYGQGNCSKVIVAAVKKALRDPLLTQKSFHDLSWRNA